MNNGVYIFENNDDFLEFINQLQGYYEDDDRHVSKRSKEADLESVA